MNEYLSTTEAAKYIGVTRVTIFRWIKEGKLEAKKIGRSFAVPMKEVKKINRPAREEHAASKGDQEKREEEIRNAVKRVVKEYGKTLKKLGAE